MRRERHSTACAAEPDEIRGETVKRSGTGKDERSERGNGDHQFKDILGWGG